MAEPRSYRFRGFTSFNRSHFNEEPDFEIRPRLAAGVAASFRNSSAWSAMTHLPCIGLARVECQGQVMNQHHHPSHAPEISRLPEQIEVLLSASQGHLQLRH